MDKKHWLDKFAESYSGTGDINTHNTADGSDTLNSVTQDPNMNGGVFMDNEYQLASMPAPLDAHDSIYNMQNRDKPDPSRSDEYSDFPFGEAVVDNNHANVVASYDGDNVAGAGANPFHNAPDSPNTMQDGHPIEELENNQQGINYVNNTDAPHANGPAANMILGDPSIVDRVRSMSDTPDINKGRAVAMSTHMNPFVRSARDIEKITDAWTGGGGSNVKDIMSPREEVMKADRSSMDFGTGDQSADNTRMDSSPNQGYSGDEYENSLYSGIQPSAADQTLRNYLRKMAAMQQEAEYVTPSANPHSGSDDQAKDVGDILPQPVAMTDGKMTPDQTDGVVGYDDQTTNVMRKKRLKVEDDDKQNYYQFENSSGGFGGEGNGVNTGIQPGD